MLRPIFSKRRINIFEFHRVWNLSTKTQVSDFKSSQRKGPTVPQFYAKVACYIKPINDFWLEAIEEREINHVWIWMHFDYWQDARRVPLLLPKMKKEDENLPHNSQTTETQRGNCNIFLLLRFHVKSKLVSLKSAILKYFEALNFDFKHEYL